MEKKKREGYF